MRNLLAFFFGASSFFPVIAQAAPESATAREPEHGVDVIAEANGGALVSNRVVVFVPDIGFSAAWRVARRWAFGAAGSVGGTSFSMVESYGQTDGAWANHGTMLWKAGGFARYDFAIAGPFRAWARGDLGLAFAHDTYDVWLNGTGLGPMSDTRTAPFVALLTGAELRPVEFVSLGVRGGGELFALSSPAGNATIGAHPAGAFAGLDLGFHLPID